VAQAADRPLAEDARAFAARERVRSVEISPSGNKLLFIMAGPGRTSALQHVDVATKASKTVARSDGVSETLHWCAFGSDTQLVCKYGGNVPLDDDIVGFSRLVTFSSEGGKARQLGQPENVYNPVLRQYDGDILDWLPDTPGSVLMQRTYAAERFRSGSNIRDAREGLAVDRIDLATLKDSQVEGARRDASNYLSDGHGNIRIMETVISTGEREDLTGLVRYKYRQRGSKEWKDLSEYNMITGAGSRPIAVDGQTDSAYLLRKLDGRLALYQVKLDGSGATTLVASNKAVDIDGVVRFGRGQRVVGYTFATEGREVVYFDGEFDKLSSVLSKALPGQPAVSFDGASNDGSKLVIMASSDTQPGTFYLFDKRTKRLDEIAPVRPELGDRTLAEVKPINIPSAGVQIPGYLTLPPKSSGRNLPAIVLPHGGPSSRDEWGFDWLAQFFAARGYAVIQPNYRGSAGFGDQWEGANGFKDWQTAITDITASARYLLDQGIADPNRLAIVGWSYGGYAALQSAAVEPALYKAAVAIAPVTDLSLLKSQAENFTNSRLVEQFVDIKHSEMMLRELQTAGKKADLLRFKGLDHQLDDSAAREQMLIRIGQLLDTTIGQ
jgi:dipeptidyl aminopeptidase/acylaminoacyl peptidase